MNETEKIKISKAFAIQSDKIGDLIPDIGYCFATNKITIEGMKVGYMYREVPDRDSDSGWRFLSGTESQDYVDNPENLKIYDVNTIANYDPDIIPYLNLPIGTVLIRISEHEFEIDKRDKPIYVTKQER